jgi:hypothetical protein
MSYHMAVSGRLSCRVEARSHKSWVLLGRFLAASSSSVPHGHAITVAGKRRYTFKIRGQDDGCDCELAALTRFLY